MLAHSGTLDKYTGDGLVAFWRATALPEQADRPLPRWIFCSGGVANQQRHADGLPCCACALASKAAWRWWGFGDFVSQQLHRHRRLHQRLASRLESAARTLPADIIIGSKAASRITSTR